MGSDAGDKVVESEQEAYASFLRKKQDAGMTRASRSEQQRRRGLGIYCKSENAPEGTARIFKSFNPPLRLNLQ